MKWMITAIALIFVYSSETFACSCAGDPAVNRKNVEAALQDADVVFVGRIESTEPFSVDQNGHTYNYQRTQFYVVQSWKGDKSARVYTESVTGCCMCGIWFPEKGTYLVYASGPKPNGSYSTGICTRTKPIDDANEEIALLDELVAKGKQTSSPSRRIP